MRRYIQIRRWEGWENVSNVFNVFDLHIIVIHVYNCNAANNVKCQFRDLFSWLCLLFCYPVHVCAAELCVRLCRSVCIYIFICMSTKTGCLLPIITWKSPAECILLLSHWVKTPPVWFATSSELYRQSNLYFSIRATWAPGPWNIVLRYAKYVLAAVQPMLKSISPLLHYSYNMNSHFSSVHCRAQCAQGMCFVEL